MKEYTCHLKISPSAFLHPIDPPINHAHPAKDGLLWERFGISSWKKVLFFDLETTGLSAKYNHIYLIGCAFFDGDTLSVRQFFAEAPEEEAAILSAFSSFAAAFSVVVTFNGTRFDLPFLKQRCQLASLDDPLQQWEHLDLLPWIAPFQELLRLPNRKQASLEQFLALSREDPYSGGELIPAYQEYVKHASSDLLSRLLAHNREDVANLTQLLPILAYRLFFEGQFEVVETSLHPYRTYEGSEEFELRFTLRLKLPLPCPLTASLKDLYVKGQEDHVRLNVKLFCGELKYFYPNYEDYYYLPAEDRAIHKSIAAYVDREFRTKAKARTCYIRKSGRFLPQYAPCFTPCFQKSYEEKTFYLELNEDFLSSCEAMKQYILHLLEALLRGSKHAS